MADIGAAAVCLSGTMTAFIAQEAVKLTERITGIISSFTDPVDALAATNITQLVKDVSSAASGNIAGNLASLGAAIIVNRIKRELNSILQDVIKREPAVGDAIQRITNLSEAVYGIISLAVMLRKEAPYSAFSLIKDDLLEVLTVKENSINAIKKHVVQLNNVIQAATDKPDDTAAQIKATLVAVAADLGTASDSLLALESKLAASPSVFEKKSFDAAIESVNAAETKLCPNSEVNILDVGDALIPQSVDSQFLTDAQLQLSTFSVRPLTVMITCEMASIERANKRINTFIQALFDTVTDYESAAQSVAMQNFRVKLVSELRKRVVQLQDDITKAAARDSMDGVALSSLSWCARMGAIKDMAPRIDNQMQAGSDDEAKLAQMRKEVEATTNAIEEIQGTNIQEGREDITAMKSQVTTLVNQGKKIMELMGSSKIDNFNMTSFQITAKTITDGAGSSLNESLVGIDDLRTALTEFSTAPSGDQTLEQLIALLQLMGLDRAKDLLKLGKFKDFLDSALDTASYIGLVIKCVVDAMELVEDSVTLDILAGIKEELEAQRIGEFSVAFDILDSGKSAAILEITNKLAEGQANLEKVKRIVSTLQDIAEKAGETAADLAETAEGLGQELGEVATGAGGALNDALSDLDIKGLQSGCSGQLEF